MKRKFDPQYYLFGVWIKNLSSILSNDYEADYLAGFSNKKPHGIEISDAQFVFNALIAMAD